MFYFKSHTHRVWNLVSDDEELTKLLQTSVPGTGFINNNNGQESVSAEEKIAHRMEINYCACSSTTFLVGLEIEQKFAITHIIR